MRARDYRLLAAVAALSLTPIFAPQAFTQRAAKRPMALQDIIAWRNIGSPTLSSDGQWFAYRLAPQEGDAEVVVRRTHGDQTTRFPAGAQPQPSGEDGGGRGGASSSALAFSDDGKFLAFTTYPNKREQERLKRQRRPVQASAVVVNLATGEKHDYPKVRRFAFSGESSRWIALQRYQPEPPNSGAGGGGRATGGAAADRPKGSDLLLVELATGTELNVGNVSELAFRKDGRYLAYAIDAQDKAGNGVQLRDMQHGSVLPLDSGSAAFEKLSWTETGDALAFVRGVENRAYRDKLYSVVGVTAIESASPRKVTYDPSSDAQFPKGMTVSPDREPQWTTSLDAIVFGIHEPRGKDPSEIEAGETPGSADAAPQQDNDDKVDLVLWHYKDPRLQTEQQVQEARDRAYSYASEYRIADKKFIRLASDEMRNVTINPKSRWAYGTDDREYELLGSLDGRRYEDVYSIDLTTGARTLLGKHRRYVFGASPDGASLLWYDDGQYHVTSLASGDDRNITQSVPVSFVDVEDDHNEIKPPVRPIGWAADNKTVLLTDAWDVWAVPVSGGQATNLTVNGKKDGIRYQQRFATEAREDRDEGIDLTQPLFFRTYGEWTKKGGVARIDPARAGAHALVWDDASYPTLIKARNANQYVYVRGSVTEPNDYYVTDANFSSPVRVTDQRPAIEGFDWSPGVRIIDYTSDKGDKLQAALFLPANYEEGKSYPMVVNFYEKMSQTANTFSAPTSNGFNRSVYTSNGYAVLMPDIVYRVNDPGMSAVWCMVPAVKAAIATGVVDPKHIGITGHSWGGYQTAFLVTQTDIFAAAVAGAPLTDMVSMYSLVYKNTGGWNGAIFESSQGRFKGGYWDNWDAYYRNSPVFFAKNVHTPLIILHNDKDGAVDFTQGLEYFNTLRRLQKPVIMLEYIGENHGLRKPANQRDYTARMKEFFDHYLKGAPAPDWMVNGVPRLKMEDHLKSRAAQPADRKATTGSPGGGGN